MVKKTAKPEKKTPTKRKRATPISFNDEKVDSIVKEITENLKNNSETEAELEEEVKLEVKEKISGEVTEEGAKETEEVSETEGAKEETSDTDASEDKEETKETSEADEANHEDKEDEAKEEVKDDNKQPEEVEEKKEGAAIFAPNADNPFPPMEEEEHKRSFKWPLIYFILFLSGMVTGFIVFDQLSAHISGFNPLAITQKPTPTKAPSATPTPEAPDFSKYTIMLENGSGISGVAADLEEQLDAAGFTVSEIGNADNSNYTETVIQIKNGTNTTFLKALKEELAKTYIVASETEELPDSEEFDAVVIIGSEEASN